jgi:hypothetical protein
MLSASRGIFSVIAYGLDVFCSAAYFALAIAWG